MKILAQFRAVCPLPVLLLAVVLAALPARAQTVPSCMAYQGYLADTNGGPLGGTNAPVNYNVIFRLWDGPVGPHGGTNELFAEIQTVTVINGSFSALLGKGNKYLAETNPPLANVLTNPANAALYIGLTVQNLADGTTNTVLPRLQLLSSPYVFQAQTALYADSTPVAYSLGVSNRTQVVSLVSNSVSINAPLNVTAAVSATNLTVTGAGCPANLAPLAVNGNASVSWLNVAGALSAASLQAANNFTVSNLNAGAGLTATGLLSAKDVQISGNVTAPGLQAGKFNVSGLLSAGTLTTTGAVTAASVNALGGVQMAGNLQAASAANDVRIISGLVSGGTVTGDAANEVVPSGGGKGLYYLTYKIPFLTPPTVVVMPLDIGAASGQGYAPMLWDQYTNFFSVQFVDYGGNAHPNDFYFMVIGR